jgi:serine/threonine-protein kinase RsbW
MEIALTLALPRDELTVPVARKIVHSSLIAVGVTRNCVDDVSVALTEACTNVIKHSGPGDEYEVNVTLDDELCSISICDVGHGFDATALEPYADDDAERGRGVQLMKALVDTIRFESRPTDGSLVHMEKKLEHESGTLLASVVAQAGGEPEGDS